MLPFLFDALSYAVSFVSLLFIRRSFQEVREARATRLLAEIKEGVTWLWNQTFLRMTMLLVTVTNFVWSAVYLSFIVRAQDLERPPE